MFWFLAMIAKDLFCFDLNIRLNIGPLVTFSTTSMTFELSFLLQPYASFKNKLILSNNFNWKFLNSQFCIHLSHGLRLESSGVGIFVFIIYGFSTRVIHIADHQWINHISQHQIFHFVICLNPLTIGDFIWLNKFLIRLKRRTIIIKSHVQINPKFPLCIIGTQKYTIFHNISHIQRTNGL